LISLLRRLFPAGLRGQVAGILLLGLLLSQAMAAALYMSLLPHWQKVSRPELAVTKVAEAQRADFAGLWSDAGFRVAYAAAKDAAPPGSRWHDRAPRRADRRAHSHPDPSGGGS
jgi:hypothetical protein